MAIREKHEGEEAEEARQLYALAKKLATQPMTFYIGKVDFENKQIDAGFVIDGGEHIDELKSRLIELQKESKNAKISTVEVGRHQKLPRVPGKRGGPSCILDGNGDNPCRHSWREFA